MRIVGSPAHLKAQRRWARNRLSARAVIEEMSLDIDFDDVVEFITPVVHKHIRGVFPGASEDEMTKMTGRIVGCAVAFAVVLVEQERLRWSHTS